MTDDGNVDHFIPKNLHTTLNFQREVSKNIDYSFEEERIKSFSSWQIHFPVDPARLAKSGFYYTGNDDEVVCFSCNGHIKNWNYGDIVQKKHSELFPTCNFVNNRSNNVPVMQHKKLNRSVSNIKETKTTSDQSKTTQINKVDYNKMQSVQERLETFTLSWPLSCIDVSKMAQAGFFYLGYEDKVQCPFCKGIVSNWEMADDPFKEHAKHFPWCNYISDILPDLNHKKMPWFQTNSEDLCGNMKKHVDSTSKSRLLDKNQEHMDLKKLGVHLYSSPAHPQQASLNSRLRSFVSWPSASPVSKEDLAKAGFFYIGIKDHTKCFHCNGGLCNWEKGDDPWVEHARWFRNCDFLRLNKGETFIEDSKQRHYSTSFEADISEETPSYMLSETLMIKVDEAMKTELVKNVLETGLFPPYIIRAAILRQIKETGTSFSSTDELCLAVAFLKEEMEKEPLRMNSCQASDLNINDIDIRKCSIALDSDGDDSNVKCDQVFLEKPQTDILKKNSKLTNDEESLSKDQCLCKICMDQEVGVVFLPCGHLLACTACAPALNLCPFCRKTIQATVRAYLP